MKAIIAVNELGYIGKDDKLPWRCKDDLMHFKEMTYNQSCLVGYNTAQKLPRLPGRLIVVDERDKFMNADWCIGGRKTYEKYSHLFTELHISYIMDYTKGDVSIPTFDNLPDDCKIFNYYFAC